MSYGLDLSEVRYETDHAGNRLKATIPYTMFSALTEFWIAARRAHTLKVEATSRPGQFKGSLQAAQVPTPEHPPDRRPSNESAHPSDRKWNALLASLPPEQSVAETTAADILEPEPKRHRRVFYREFVEAPPAEVMQRIECGTYFIRAWREYRGLTLEDAADLLSRDKTTVIWHESGKTAPKAPTLERFSQIYDCPVAQMTPKPGSDVSTFYNLNAKADCSVMPRTRRAMSEPRAPTDTDYPDAVMAHLIAGKSPMLAWRLYRNMTLKALAEAYGNTASNVKAMESNGWLRPTTIEKLCRIFHCSAAQLLRPEGMRTSRDAMPELSVAIVTGREQAAPTAGSVKGLKLDRPVVTSAMESAFVQAGLPRQRDRDKNRTRSRLRSN